MLNLHKALRELYAEKQRLARLITLLEQLQQPVEEELVAKLMKGYWEGRPF